MDEQRAEVWKTDQGWSIVLVHRISWEAVVLNILDLIAEFQELEHSCGVYGSTYAVFCQDYSGHLETGEESGRWERQGGAAECKMMG